MADPGTVTGLLLAWGKGDAVALQQLLRLVERELHVLRNGAWRESVPGR